MILTAAGADQFLPNGCLLGLAAVPYRTTDLHGNHLHGEIVGCCGVGCGQRRPLTLIKTIIL